MELTNDQDHTFWHPKAGEYFPEEGSVNGVVRFGKVDKVDTNGINFFRTNSCSRRRITKIMLVVERFGRKPLLLLRLDPRALTVLTEAASDDLQ